VAMVALEELRKWIVRRRLTHSESGRCRNWQRPLPTHGTVHRAGVRI
jgi:hypothetical protein